MMDKGRAGGRVILAVLLTVGVSGAALAGEGAAGFTLLDQKSLTAGLFGAEEVLEERGLTVVLGLTQVYQQNVRGGLSTRRTSQRFPGSYDLELEADLERLIGLPGGLVHLLAEGSWRDGISDSAVGSLFGVNDDAGGDRAVDVTELWYQQDFAGGAVRVRLGKLDLTGGFECRTCPVTFDGNSFANDETVQFLNSALVNNPTIPFPQNGLGLIVYLQPAEWAYVSAGVADAEADARETGFSTTFGGPGHFFSVYEAGVVAEVPSPGGALTGAYRAGLWYDPQPKERLDGRGRERDDLGFYASVDQMLFRESPEEGNAQGLGLFARLGVADQAVNEVRFFWSAGAQYQGLLPTRDDDVVALGVAQGRLSPDADFTTASETAIELYYSARITPWVRVTPSVQVILNPGGDDRVNDAWSSASASRCVCDPQGGVGSAIVTQPVGLG